MTIKNIFTASNFWSDYRYQDLNIIDIKVGVEIFVRDIKVSSKVSWTALYF